MSEPSVAASVLAKVLEKAGLVPDNCERIVIDITAGNLVRIYYACIGTERLLEADIINALIHDLSIEKEKRMVRRRQDEEGTKK